MVDWDHFVLPRVCVLSFKMEVYYFYKPVISIFCQMLNIGPVSSKLEFSGTNSPMVYGV